ncbi:MAG: shikimate dehydrogenase [Bacteroidetes bacterium]|jgi:shikimate dehydrogenase|nr:shikimate dehydrogenase [Bacteroidota bacterium]
MPIDAETQLVTLLGDPVEHSLSPLLHNTAFAAQEINAAYVATRVAVDDLPAAVEGLRAMRFLGANVTIPHKQAVQRLLDDVTPRAEAVGAVNTIVCEAPPDGPPRLRGDNTDVTGFLAPLQPHADRLQDAEVLLFGAGGAARAVVYALLTEHAPSRLTLAVRTPSKAEPLVLDMMAHAAAAQLEVVPIDEAGPALRASTLVVNATPLGMHPDVDRTPWPDADDFAEAQIVYDLVYNPTTTRLLREAEARGATPIGGLDMLIGQAAAAYAQWTDCPMPEATVRQALHAHGVLVDGATSP